MATRVRFSWLGCGAMVRRGWRWRSSQQQLNANIDTKSRLIVAINKINWLVLPIVAMTAARTHISLRSTL